jgi:hypothetical protein
MTEAGFRLRLRGARVLFDILISVFICGKSEYACAHNFHKGRYIIKFVQQLKQPQPPRLQEASGLVQVVRLFLSLHL